MGIKDVKKRFEEVNIGKELVCTQPELESFVSYGLLFGCGEKYVTRDGAKVVVIEIPDNNYQLRLNFRNLLDVGASLCTTSKNKRIYCMSEATFDKYNQQGLIIEQGGDFYYRMFENELWKIYKI